MAKQCSCGGALPPPQEYSLIVPGSLPPGSSWLLLAPPGSPWLPLAAPCSPWLLLAPPGSSLPFKSLDVLTVPLWVFLGAKKTEKSGGASRKKEGPGGARRSQEEPGGATGARRSQEQPGAARTKRRRRRMRRRRSQEEPRKRQEPLHGCPKGLAPGFSLKGPQGPGPWRRSSIARKNKGWAARPLKAGLNIRWSWWS